MFGIAPSQTQFLNEIAAKKPIIWHASMRFLFCFGRKFYEEYGGDDLAITWQENHPGYALAYPLHVLRKDRKDPLGFQMSGLEYVVQRTRWLDRQDAAGAIPAYTLIDEIEIWLKAEDAPDMERHLANPALAATREFLQHENIMIPSSIWMQAVGTKRH